MPIDRKQILLMEDEVALALEGVTSESGLTVQQSMSAAIFIFSKLFKTNSFDVILENENSGDSYKICIDCSIEKYFGDIDQDNIEHEA